MADVSWTTTILPPVIGGVLGLGGSLTTLWVKWGIEKTRMRVLHRQELVGQWRVLLSDLSWAKTNTNWYGKPPVFYDGVQTHQFYSSLQRHLNEKTLDLLAKTRHKIGQGDEVQAAYDAMLEDVNTAERMWKLVE
jgi:hypothetical protein